jgi:hypothetical protein
MLQGFTDQTMRGSDTFTESMSTMRRLDDFVRPTHPRRPVRTDWDCERPLGSFCVLPLNTPKQHLHEIENDLIAGHYHSHGSPPAMQFRNAKVTRDQRVV